MATDKMIQIRSGGRRISLYAEVGKYFLPDGHLNEEVLRSSIKISLEKLKEQYPDQKEFATNAQQWLSTYLIEIIDYLKERGMQLSAFQLFKEALDVSTQLGVGNVTVPAEYLHEFLSLATLPTTTESKKRDTSENRKKIFAAALKLFVEKGFHATTVDEIAALSGVGKGTVYRKFSSKQELLDQLLLEKNLEIVDMFIRVFSRDDDVLKQIQEALELWVTFIEENHLLYRLIQREEIFKRSENRSIFYDTIVSNLPMIKERIVSLNLDGKLKTTNFYTVFYGILGFIDGVVHKWLRSGMDYSLRDDIPIILEVLFNGFVGEKTSGSRFFIPPEE